jgi:hypothetical protein
MLLSTFRSQIRAERLFKTQVKIITDNGAQIKHAPGNFTLTKKTRLCYMMYYVYDLGAVA